MISDSRVREVEVTAMNGTRVFYTLPDSTSVWLRGGSKLVFAENMDKAAEQRVELIGEGYFDVKKNKK
ncbi:MAG: FecR family protein [Tannerellaceae bacterium]|nr:FecR family protein [Tannerellaceae bacterium]